MNANGVARHYGRIEADERFRLELRAAARDDHQEVERLARSCPKSVYRMNDAAFVDRASAARLLAVLVIGEIRPHFARAAVLRASAEATKRALVLGMEIAHEALDTVPSEDELTEAHEAIGEGPLGQGFEDLIASDLAQAAAVWQAFGSTCREEMGVEPTTVIAATFGRGFPPLQTDELDQLAAAEADPQAVAGWRDAFVGRWRRAL